MVTLTCRVLFPVISIIGLVAPFSTAQIRVGLFSSEKVNQLLVSPVDGQYFLLSNDLDTIYRFRSDDAVLFQPNGNSVVAKSAYGLNDTLKAMILSGSGNKPSFKTRINDERSDGTYYGSLVVTAGEGTLNPVNSVDVERYVSRVVQAEVGYGAVAEYYKIQSIICRTYAIRNLERHTSDGYDLCDNMHCQVYSGQKHPTDEVVKATAATAGLIMLSKEDDLVLSAFHSNCGGQTANSEDVWRESRSYLRSVSDTFCLSSRSAKWEKSVPVNEFFNQLGWKNITLNGTFEWKHDARQKYFRIGNDSIDTSTMRRLFGLRSAYFNVEIADGSVLFRGRGYGHGVGLCQQGAMKMAEAGYNYGQILGYYYKGVSLTPVSNIQP